MIVSGSSIVARFECPWNVYCGTVEPYTDADIAFDFAATEAVFEVDASVVNDIFTKAKDEETGKHILDAVFVANTYTVIFSDGENNGVQFNLKAPYEALSFGATYDETYNVGDIFESITRTGYVLTGFTSTGSAVGYEGENKENLAAYTIKNLATEQGAEVTVVPTWQAISFSISFDANGGTGSKTYDVEYDYNKNDLKFPTQFEFDWTGYTLQGWALDNDAQTATYAAGADLSTDIINTLFASVENNIVTLYAVWSVNSYRVYLNTLKPANASTSVSDASVGENYYVDNSAESNKYYLVCYGNENFEFPTNYFTLEGYTFAGWNYGANIFAEGANYGAPLTTEDGAILEIVTTWTACTLAVVYDKNQPANNNGTIAGDVSEAYLTLTFDAEYTIADNTSYTLDGYTLLGFASDAAATEALVSPVDADDVNAWFRVRYDEASGTYGSLTLYAVWQANTLQVLAK